MTLTLVYSHAGLEHEQSIFILWRKTHRRKEKAFETNSCVLLILELGGVTLPLVEQYPRHDTTLHEATKSFCLIFLKQKVVSHTHIFFSGARKVRVMPNRRTE